jgi:hypothetical protein
MLIDSDFHDYYDTAATYGIDKTIVYTRKTKSQITTRHASKEDLLVLPDGSSYVLKTNAPRGDLPLSERLSGVRGGWGDAYKWLLGFCGSFYPVVHLSYYSQLQSPSSSSYYFYDAESLQEHLVQMGLSDQKDRRGYGKWYSERSEDVCSEYGRKNIFNVERWGKHDFLFHAFKTPVFLLGYNWPDHHQENALVLNPCLKDLGFMRIKDPHTAFQDIQSYISGVIGMPAKPMVEISDKDKAAAKGHDSPYSFRKPPGKRSKNGPWR